MNHYDVLIVGAGHAGAQAAISLRQNKFEGSIAIIGDEPDLPYERPPLSKDYLQGEKTFDRITIRPADFWANKGVDMVLGSRVMGVDPKDKVVVTERKETYGYGKLIWATGGTPRRLTCGGSDLKGVHYIRNRTDVDALVSELETTRNVVVIGGGYIGLEAAAVLRKQEKSVVLLEALERVLARATCEKMSRFIESQHRQHGVDVRLGVAVAAIEGVGNRTTGVCLADGSSIPADMVIVGIGIVPAVQPLLMAGAKGGNGIEVDNQCKTSLPCIFAIGDCALHPNRYAGGQSVRVESVQNAVDQAGVVAKVIMGQDVAYDSIPWFWSNQYDLKFQTVGLAVAYDQVDISGDMDVNSFSITYRKEGKPIAVDCVNSPRDYAAAKKLIQETFS